MIKRAFDIAVSAAALIVLSPLLLLLVVVVRISSPGPALFRQERVGRHGKSFHIHKFRTMRADAEGPLVSTGNDRRITTVGRLLRRSKIDELPQLIDVLRGDMSIVGPRPEVLRYVALWPEDQRALILSVRPGITDPASIELRDESLLLTGVSAPEQYYVDVLLPRKTALYAHYVRTRSFRSDLAIIVRTVAAVVRPAPTR